MVFSPLTIPILTSDILIILLMFVFVTFLLLIIILRTKINWILKLFIIISSTVVYVFVAYAA